MTLSAVLFDIDGTLADTEPQAHLPAYNAVFAELGLDWSWGQSLYRELLQVPGGRERIAYYLSEHKPSLGMHEAAYQQDPSAWIDRLHEGKSRYFGQRMADGHVPLRPGVARLFKEIAAAGVLIGVVTNASRGTLVPVIDHLLDAQLSPLVSVFVCGDEVANKKPAPDPYLSACQALGVDPARCVAVEDSRTGLRAASAAGICTLITFNADTSNEDFSQAAAVLDCLGEPGAACVSRSGPAWAGGYVQLAGLRTLLAD